MKKYIVLALFLSIISITPAFALTSPLSLEQQIAGLRSQITNLTAQLNQLLAQQRGNFCYDFKRDIPATEVSDEVINLKEVLRFENVSTVKEFQSKYRISATGYVGPLTRAKLNELYGCKDKVFITPSDLGTAKVGQTYDRQLIAHGFGPRKVDWKVVGAVPSGLEVNYEVQSYGSVGGPFSIGISGVPTVAGIYNLTVQAASGTTTATQAYTLEVKAASTTATSSITVLSPNGDEVWGAGTTEDIKWSWPNAKRTDKVDLYLRARGTCEYMEPCLTLYTPFIELDKNMPAQADYGWIVATDMRDKSIQSGQYLTYVCPAGTDINGELNRCDSSDQPFSIVVPLPTTSR